MPLRIEFYDESLDDAEYRKTMLDRGFRIREPLARQSSGRLGVYIGYARLPSYLDQAPPLPEEWLPRYFFIEKLYDVDLKQGRYEYADQSSAVVIDVQKVKDKSVNAKDQPFYFQVDIQGERLAVIVEAFRLLVTGRLKPKEEWSSPGSIEAPKAEAREPSGSHTLPQTAATTQAA
jgi:hypothetical protein